MGIAGAILGAGAITGIAGIAGSAMASGAQQDAANTAANTQLSIYGQNKAMLSPWANQGLSDYGTLNSLLGVGGNSATMQSTLEGLPGYQFTLGQGLKSVQNSAAARGLGVSGAALKGAANYSTGLANSQYGNYVGQLQNATNTGLSAANALAGVGTQTGAGVASSQIAGGNAAAAGYNGIAGSIGNAAGSLPLAAILSQNQGGLGGLFGGGGSGQSSGPLFGWT